MQAKKHFIFYAVILLASSMLVSGCAVNFYKQSPRNKKKIKALETQVNDLESQRDLERQQFEEARRLLEEQLRSQINEEDVFLSVDERGLVIILSNNILFDSGKADIKKEAYPVLDKVSNVIVTKVPGKNIGIGGHTDNVPIKHSNWKSNWELSTTRATNVLHYLIGRKVAPGNLSATGYGEHRPVASNATKKDRAKNRRVEIVILPEYEEIVEEETEKTTIK